MRLIKRAISDSLLELAEGFPVLFITGPRQTGVEIDLLFEDGDQLVPWEIKSSQAAKGSFIDNIQTFRSWSGDMVTNPRVIYCGNDTRIIKGVEYVPWNQAFK